MFFIHSRWYGRGKRIVVRRLDGVVKIWWAAICLVGEGAG
jgi:hypothetical protein